MKAKESLEDNPLSYEEIAPFMHLYKGGFDGQAVIDGLEGDGAEWSFSATGGSGERRKFSLTRDSRSLSLDTYVEHPQASYEEKSDGPHRVDLDDYVNENSEGSSTSGQEASFDLMFHLERAIWHYRLHYDLHLKTGQGWGVIKYGHGGHYLLHIDHGGVDARQVSILAYLNDVEKGGETVFPYMKTTIKPAEGNIVVFPSSYPYAHLAAPAVDPKYVVVSWFV